MVFTWAPAIDGAFVLTTRGGDFALHIGQDLSIGYLSHSDTAVRTKGFLVDLVGFEPTTSSMPFKKYQSLADSLAQNKRLSKRRRGLRWTPRGGFQASGLHADSKTPNTGWHVACFLRARLQAALFVVFRRRQQSVSI